MFFEVTLSLSCLFSKSLFLFSGLAFLFAGTGARGTRLTLCVVISLWAAGVFGGECFFSSFPPVVLDCEVLLSISLCHLDHFIIIT